MSSNLIGSLIWLLFIFLSVFSHMIIKSLTGEVDFIITLFARFVYSLPILFILALIARKMLFLQINNWNNIFIRSLFGFVTMIMVFSSLQLIPIGLTTALAQSSAIYVTLLKKYPAGILMPTILSSIVVFTLIFDRCIFNKKIRKIDVLCIFLIAVSIYILTTNIQDDSKSLKKWSKYLKE